MHHPVQFQTEAKLRQAERLKTAESIRAGRVGHGTQPGLRVRLRPLAHFLDTLRRLLPGTTADVERRGEIQTDSA